MASILSRPQRVSHETVLYSQPGWEKTDYNKLDFVSCIILATIFQTAIRIGKPTGTEEAD